MYSEQVRMIKCSICGEKKETTAFSPRKNRPCGFESRCKECNSKRALKYHKTHRDKVLPKMRERARSRYAADPRDAKFWGKTNKEHIKRATPKWSDLSVIRQFYDNCPKDMTIDHIVPLRSKIVSGLHVVWNLQYLTASENSRKHTKLEQELEARDKEP